MTYNKSLHVSDTCLVAHIYIWNFTTFCLHSVTYNPKSTKPDDISTGIPDLLYALISNLFADPPSPSEGPAWHAWNCRLGLGRGLCGEAENNIKKSNTKNNQRLRKSTLLSLTLPHLVLLVGRGGFSSSNFSVINGLH